MARFLLVDDSQTIRISLKNAIKQAGAPNPTFLEAPTAAQAISEFRTHDPDVVFLDMMLGIGWGGTDVLKVMLAERPEAKIILITSLGRDRPEVVQAISLGAFGHVQKPEKGRDGGLEPPVQREQLAHDLLANLPPLVAVLDP
ncbi:MAG: response regulator, partial [Euryarchaeota archaeon]|nr:response regulator [Euryarchaeota archaeon]